MLPYPRISPPGVPPPPDSSLLPGRGPTPWTGSRRPGGHHNRRLVDVPREPGQDVKPGRGADRSEFRQVAGQRREQHVAPDPVNHAQPAQVPVELAGGQEIRKRQLLDDRRARSATRLAVETWSA